MRIRKMSLGLALLICLASGVGCKSASVTEINGKSSFGPEFRNYGNNTHDIRYTAIQGVEFKMSNKWTVNMSFQRRDVDEGSGDNENAILVEVGYPIWNAPKKAEKAAEEMLIEDLEKELRQLDSELTAASDLMPDSAATAFVPPANVDEPFEKEKGE